MHGWLLLKAVLAATAHCPQPCEASGYKASFFTASNDSGAPVSNGHVEDWAAESSDLPIPVSILPSPNGSMRLNYRLFCFGYCTTDRESLSFVWCKFALCYDDMCSPRLLHILPFVVFSHRMLTSFCLRRRVQPLGRMTRPSWRRTAASGLTNRRTLIPNPRGTAALGLFETVLSLTATN